MQPEQDHHETSSTAEQALLRYGIELGWWRTGKAFAYSCRQMLFPGIELRNRRMLDVGCGPGYCTLWAAAQGASLATGMEPALEGSRHEKELDILRTAASDLNLTSVTTSDATLQSANLPDQYDVVLVRHAINHLSEPDCIELHRSEAAREAYRSIFGKLLSMVAPGGVVVLTDVAKRNWLGDLKLRHPLMPTIEWHKHQQPRLWAQVLRESGFVSTRTSWLSPGMYLQAGWFLRNPLMAYLTRSEFRILAYAPTAKQSVGKKATAVEQA